MDDAPLGHQLSIFHATLDVLIAQGSLHSGFERIQKC